ncbi:PREDICTED: uncharacterized protein LOC106806906 isoform X2 [Priapulus caudatus]|uniref:Uncharacterized protein LOC106806906 isoform X2 n=1 Tax=Priapulus caudatus TaxID=37621 RepID=A0ABM1DX67_PRICU|nr:PREDICTED: uncharacterized protein LOC106806906 isoform X2 [Priapulus caudatus]
MQACSANAPAFKAATPCHLRELSHSSEQQQHISGFASVRHRIRHLRRALSRHEPSSSSASSSPSTTTRGRNMQRGNGGDSSIIVGGGSGVRIRAIKAELFAKRSRSVDADRIIIVREVERRRGREATTTESRRSSVRKANSTAYHWRDRRETSATESNRSSGREATPVTGHRSSSGKEATTVTGHRRSSGREASTVTEHRRSSGRETTPVTGHRRSSGKEASTVTGHRRSSGREATTVTEHRRSSGKEASTVTEHHRSSGKEATPVTEHRSSSGKEASTVTEHRSSSGKEATTVTEHRRSSGKEASTVTEHRRSSGKEATPVTEHRRSSGKEASTVTGHRSSSGKEASTVTEHRSSSGREASASLGEHAAVAGESRTTARTRAESTDSCDSVFYRSRALTDGADRRPMASRCDDASAARMTQTQCDDVSVAEMTQTRRDDASPARITQTRSDDASATGVTQPRCDAESRRRRRLSAPDQYVASSSSTRPPPAGADETLLRASQQHLEGFTATTLSEQHQLSATAGRDANAREDALAGEVAGGHHTTTGQRPEDSGEQVVVSTAVLSVQDKRVAASLSNRCRSASDKANTAWSIESTANRYNIEEQRADAVIHHDKTVRHHILDEAEDFPASVPTSENSKSAHKHANRKKRDVSWADEVILCAVQVTGDNKWETYLTPADHESIKMSAYKHINAARSTLMPRETVHTLLYNDHDEALSDCAPSVVRLRVPIDINEDRMLDRSDSGKSTDSGFADATRNLSTSDDESGETTARLDDGRSSSRVKGEPEIVIFTDESSPPTTTSRKMKIFQSLSNIPLWKKKTQNNPAMNDDSKLIPPPPMIVTTSSDEIFKPTLSKLTQQIHPNMQSNIKMCKSTTDIGKVDSLDPRALFKNASTGSLVDVSPNSSTNTLCGAEKPPRPHSPKPPKSPRCSRSVSNSSTESNTQSTSLRAKLTYVRDRVKLQRRPHVRNRPTSDTSNHDISQFRYLRGKYAQARSRRAYSDLGDHLSITQALNCHATAHKERATAARNVVLNHGSENTLNVHKSGAKTRHSLSTMDLKKEHLYRAHQAIRSSRATPGTECCKRHSVTATMDLPGDESEVGSKSIFAEALWDHVTMDPDELPFRVGEVIEVIDNEDSDWWWGVNGETEGWFPASFVRVRVNQEETMEDSLENLSQGSDDDDKLYRNSHGANRMSKDEVRAKVIEEIINTERDFVGLLKNLCHGFLHPAKQRPDMFSREMISIIFSNIEEIYKFQTQFMSDLERNVDLTRLHVSSIGGCFLRQRQGFEIYSEYCNNHPQTTVELCNLTQEKQYRHFFEGCRLMQNMINISLDGFLLTPVQRICKYPLQLAELLKHTRPDHPDYNDVKLALAAMLDVATLINECKRKKESLEKLAIWQLQVIDWQGPPLLDQSCLLIYSGEVTRVSSKWDKECNIFLFDHQMVICRKELLKKGTYTYKTRLGMNFSDIIDVDDGRDIQYNATVHNAWKVYSQSQDKWYLFYVKTPSEKKRWMAAFAEERESVRKEQEKGGSASREERDAAMVVASKELSLKTADVVRKTSNAGRRRPWRKFKLKGP